MIKCLLIIILIFSSVSVYAGEMHGNFEVGAENTKGWFFVNLNLEYVFSLSVLENYVYGGNQIWFIFDKGHGFPIRDIYTIGYKAMYRQFYGRIEHSCNHPVYSINNEQWWNENRQIFGNITTFSLGIEW